MPIEHMKLRERQVVPEIPDRHKDGDCHCFRLRPSGRVYMGWPACRVCFKLPRRKPE